MIARALLTTALVVSSLAAVAAAQTPAPADPAVPGTMPAVAAVEADTRLPGRFLLGANVTNLFTPDGDIGGQLKFGGFFSLRPREGWGPAFGLSWFRSDLRLNVNGSAESVGTLRVRPLMGGVGYTFVRGHASARLSLVGGYAFTRATLNEDRLEPGIDLTLALRETWVAQPSFDVIYGVARRLAVVGSLEYTFARPRLEVTATDGVAVQRISRRLRGDYVGVTLGVAVSIF